MLVTSFPWLASSHSKSIILGSMPGVESIRIQQYYGHPRNQFWRIFYALHGAEWSENYEDRKKFLLSKETALWDVLSHCEREGSLDTDIQNPIMNDFNQLFTEFPAIQTLFFNGGKAYELFIKYVVPHLTSQSHVYQKLPSSSPAYTLSFENKLNMWKIILL